MPSSTDPVPDPARVFLPGFERAGAPYMVTGGVGAIVYGEPRMTNDIDIVLALRPAEAPRFLAAFEGGEIALPPEESVRTEAGRERHGHLNLHHLESMLRADIYLAGRDPLQAWGLERRRRCQLGGGEGWVAAPEYIILQKLLFRRQGGSERHLRDIAWMLRVSEALIDRPLLEMQVRELGVDSEWEAALATRLDA